MVSRKLDNPLTTTEKENMSTEAEEGVRTLAHVAAQASELAVRLAPRIDRLKDVAYAMQMDVEEAYQEAYEAVGLEPPTDEFLDRVMDHVQGRLESPYDLSHRDEEDSMATEKVDPVDATTWGDPIFSADVRQAFRETVIGYRTPNIRPIVAALFEIVQAETSALYDREGIDPRTWFLEGCGDHLRKALIHLDNAEAEYRRSKGIGFPGGADGKEMES